MISSKGASILFAKSDEVAKGASWQQLAKARHRQKRGLTAEQNNAHSQVHQVTEEGDDPLKVLEQKIRDERMRQEHLHRPHQHQEPVITAYDDDEDDSPQSFRRSLSRSAYNDED